MITITSTTAGIKVDFNGYFEAGLTNVKTGYWAKSTIGRVLNHGTYIEIIALGDSWLLNLDGSDNLFGIESVDGATPTTLDDLYTKFVEALI